MQLFRVPRGEFEEAWKENNALVEGVKESPQFSSRGKIYTTVGQERIIH